MANTKFFISYRRELHQQLAADIAISLTEICGTGSVFLDRDPVSLPPGTVWPRQIVNGLSQANAVLALIDDAWFAELRTRNFLSGCWLPWSSSDDWIRFEIYLALKAGKTVIPVLVGPDVVMRADLLSPEIEELADRQQFTLNEKATLSEQLCRLLDFLPDSVSADSSVEHPITDLLGEPELIDQRSSQEIGELWDPETETESPQAKDFKFCISNQAFREQLKLDFLLGCIRGYYPASIKLDDFKSAGEPRKFQHSSSKKGMFLQCSCIVTDGLDTGLPEHVLLSTRSVMQFHDPNDVRNITGTSCLIATCMSQFALHDGQISLPVALLDDLSQPNRWAVFSRKLLIPDSQLESSFLGLGFNFERSDKEYLHLVWHIRVRRRPPVMLVPQRQKKTYDVPIWVKLEELSQFNFSDAPIDHAVLMKMFPSNVPASQTAMQGFHGFLEAPSIAGAGRSASCTRRFERDTAALDLALMFQQAIHRKQLHIDDFCPEDVLQAFGRFISSINADYSLPFQTHDLPNHPAEHPFRTAVRLTMTDDQGNALRHYCVVSSQSAVPQPTANTIRAARKVAQHLQYTKPNEFSAVLVLNPVQTDDCFALHNPLSLHRRSEMPIHMIQIAVEDLRIPRREVAHGIIFVQPDAGASADSILFTHSAGDTRWKLPGGKIEGIETPRQALARELWEELRLEPGDYVIAREIVPGGISSFETSPRTNRMTHYTLHPFLLRLLNPGIAKLYEHLHKPGQYPCEPMLAGIDEWQETGLGFDPIYAQTVLGQLTRQEILASACNLPTP